MKKVAALILFLIPLSGFGQQRPKVGLCLSGGGAKGFAHIGLLKVIDSAGLKVDYISGTSMGAVMGGMYSIGYSAKELEEIARRTDWSLLLSNHVPMTDINVEEKDEFGRYISELPLVGLRPGLPLGMIEGQELTLMLSELAFPIHGVTNFDSLPIPFHCIAADILTGEVVVLKNGYLPSALRASMAIPSIFTPVKLNGRLLVDGGLLNNFPVTEVKNMGGDIVIGGYTGGRLYDEEQLNSGIKLVYQAASFNHLNDSKVQMELCNLLANYDTALKNYSAASFRDVDSIIDIGYRIALQLYPQIKHLADSLKALSPSTTDTSRRYTEKAVFVTDVAIEGTTAKNFPFILGKLDIVPYKFYTVSEIEEAVTRVYGTRFYDKVSYSVEEYMNGHHRLLVTVKEARKSAIKFAVHYDTEQASGILLNLTLRDILGRNSRLLGTFDLSEYPKARLQYQKFIGKSRRYWYSAGHSYEYTPIRLFNFGRLQDELNMAYNVSLVALNYSLSKNDYIGGSFNYENIFIRAKILPEDRAQPPNFEVRHITFYETSLNLNYYKNTLNRVNIPTSGKLLTATLRLVPEGIYHFNFYSQDSALYPNKISDQRTVIRPALKLIFRYSHLYPISKKFTLINNLSAGLILDIRSRPGNLYSEAALPGFYFAGGVQQRARAAWFPFLGYREGELSAPQLAVINTEVQYEIFHKLFIKPGASFMVTGQKINTYFQNLTRWNFTYINYDKGVNHAFGYGITLAYKWFGGPVSFTLYKASGVPDFRGYFSVGYKF